MSFTKMTDDLNIIQGLPDLPNDVGGLTAAQLKAKAFLPVGSRPGKKE